MPVWQICQSLHKVAISRSAFWILWVFPNFLFGFFFLGIVTEREEIKEGGFDILSFDGGGTKGVMEAFIMNDIMNISIWILLWSFSLKLVANIYLSYNKLSWS